MAEIKNNFIRGRMNKDLDERLLPNGEYRDAMNIQVSTSEEDSVGTVQNILGNISVGHTLPQLVCIGTVADEKNNHVYYFATTVIGTTKNYIFRYEINSGTHTVVFRDLNNILNFNPDIIITGINVIDDMLFFTDNINEPKKINIERSIDGTDQFDDTAHTNLIVEGTNFGAIEESHITVIKKAPNYAPVLEMVSDIPEGNISGLVPSVNQNLIGTAFEVDFSFNFDTHDVGDTFYVVVDSTPDADGPIFNINVNDEVVFTEYEQNIPAIPLTDYLIRGVVVAKNENPVDPGTGNPVVGVTQFGIRIITKSVDTPIGLDDDNRLPTYAMSLFIDPKGMFEFKFPRFSTRFKYEDGEYSTFGPFTEVAFIASDFDYEPKKGYNIGMTNKLKELYLKQFVPNDIPDDVVSIDLLYKESDSVAVFVLASLSSSDPIITTAPYNGLNEYTFQNSIDIVTDLGPVTRDIKRSGRYQVKSETIYALVNQNQLIRPFDNVPRKALGQEVSGSRLIYGNYLQNYDIPRFSDKLVFQTDTFSDAVTAGKTYKSIKSLREYQLGIVYLDEYGRQSPVLTDSRASVNLDKSYSARSTRLYARVKGSAPSWATSFKFYIKETSGAFYNLAMDRYYDAQDGNIWLAFPSSDRNKVDIDTFLILKKGADSDFAITNLARYKILAIENQAPEYIKTVYKPLGSIIHNTSSSAPQTIDVFGTVGGSLRGANEFVIEGVSGGGYLFRDTSLFNIYKQIEDTKIRVRFEDLDSGTESKNYIVNNIGYDSGTTNDGSPTGSIKVRIDDDFGTDVDFLTLDQTTGTHNAVVYNNIRVVFEEIAVENAAKFDGRFFVKIYNNETTRNEIGSREASDTRKYRRLASRKVYYLAENNTDLHSYSGSGTYPGSQDPFDTPTTNPGGGSRSSPTDYHNQGITYPTTFNSPIENFLINSDTERSFFYKYNAFFRGSITYDIDDRSQASSSTFEDVWFIDGNTPRKILTAGNSNVIGADHTGSSGGNGSVNPTSTNGGIPVQGPTPGIGQQGSGSNAVGIIELGFGGLEPEDDNALVNYSLIVGGLSNINSNNYAHVNGGIGPQQAVTLGFGGSLTQQKILGKTVNGGQTPWWTKGTSTIFNIGQPAVNSKYQDQQDFVDELAIGAKLRWKEDTNTPQNVYTITNIKYYYVLRYEEPHFKYGGSAGTAIGRRWFGNDPLGPLNQNYGQTTPVWYPDGQGQLMRYNGQGEPAFALRPENYQIRFKIELDRPVVWNPLDDATLGGNQDAMNGFSPNSVEAFAKLGTTVTAQGYTLEIVIDDDESDEKVSTNPAIWETEPKETVDLDVYYEASDRHPVALNEDNIVDVLKIGSKVVDINNSGDPNNDFVKNNEYIIDGHVGNNTLILNRPTTGTHFDTATGPYSSYPQTPAVVVEITTPENNKYQLSVLDVVATTSGNQIEISTNLHNSGFDLNWYNCYSFGNGVESNRIEDNFNRVTIDKGAVASTTLEEGLYKEERRKYGLIFSGLYNSTSGVNNLNQFIQAEKITKDVNPNYGSIQKLFSRQSDLIALCEDKILKILANKDAVFNADGNPQLTANTNVLGQTIPFVGDYGISKNPESFAKESYRAYFTDKQRGAVLRLSMDGLTPISDAGMSDWFGDNLEKANFLVGSYDQDKSKYNLVIDYSNHFGTKHIRQPGKKSGYDLINNDETSYCLSFSERNKGWVTFNSFIYENAVSCANKYFSFKYGIIYEHHLENLNRNSFYGSEFDYSALTFNVLTGTSAIGVITTDPTYTASNVKFIFNQEPNIIKEFRALNYEGSRSRLLDEYVNNSYKNLDDQTGWFASSIRTNMERGVVPYFVEKESKWFNYIKGNQIIFDGNNSLIDASKFSVQGIGLVDTVTVPPPTPIYGCTDDGSDPNFPGRPTGFVGQADNYNANANTDDGSCTWTVVYGCTDPTALNYDPLATMNDGSCIAPVPGCTDGTGANNPYTPSTGPATNYNPLATVDDGSCIYTPPTPPPFTGAVMLNGLGVNYDVEYYDAAGTLLGTNAHTSTIMPNSPTYQLQDTSAGNNVSLTNTYNLDLVPAHGGVAPYTYKVFVRHYYVDTNVNPGFDPLLVNRGANEVDFSATGLNVSPHYGDTSATPPGASGNWYQIMGPGTSNAISFGSWNPGDPHTQFSVSEILNAASGATDIPEMGGTVCESVHVCFKVETTDSSPTPQTKEYYYIGVPPQTFVPTTAPFSPGNSCAAAAHPFFGQVNYVAPQCGGWNININNNTYNSLAGGVSFSPSFGGSHPPYTYSNLQFREVELSTNASIPGISPVTIAPNPLPNTGYNFGPLNWPSNNSTDQNIYRIQFEYDYYDSNGQYQTCMAYRNFNRPANPGGGTLTGGGPYIGPTTFNLADISYQAITVGVYVDLTGTPVNIVMRQVLTLPEAVHFHAQGVDVVGLLPIPIQYGNNGSGGSGAPYNYPFRMTYKDGLMANGNLFTYSGTNPYVNRLLVNLNTNQAEFFDIHPSTFIYSQPYVTVGNIQPTDIQGFYQGLGQNNAPNGIVVDTSFIADASIYGGNSGINLYGPNAADGFGVNNGDQYLDIQLWLDTQDSSGTTANPQLDTITINYV